MNYGGNDYAMCHLIRRAKLSGTKRLHVDLLARTLGPTELLSSPLLKSCDSYCRDFGRLVTSSGAAMDMIQGANLQAVVALGRLVGEPSKALHGRVTVTVTITDDRGKVYVGRAIEDYGCSPLR